MKKEKMVKIAKALDTLFKVLKRIIVICAAVCVAILGIFTIMSFSDPHFEMGKYFRLIYMGSPAFVLPSEITLNNSAILIYAWIMVAAAIAIIFVICYAISILRKILAPMTQGNPFHPTVGTEIRKLAFASLIIGIIRNVMGVVETLNMFNIFHLDIFLLNRQIEPNTVNVICFDPGFLIVFFILLLMSYIFQYGEELQKLSDETL